MEYFCVNEDKRPDAPGDEPPSCEDAGSGRSAEHGGLVVVAISAFYDAQAPDGINAFFRSSNWADLREHLKVLREGADQLWQRSVDRAETSILVAALESELTDLRAKARETWSQADFIMAIVTVDLLERTGHLKTDDHNGVLLLEVPRAIQRMLRGGAE
jgi:hypothetical protein